MQKLTTFSVVVLVLVGLVSGISGQKTSAKAGRPHIVIFMMDDVGWADVGYREGSGMLTPNIDAMAATGVLFDRYYTQPVCSPSRAALMQGRYPFRTGMQHYTTIHPASKAHLPLDIPTLPELLGQVGYDPHAIGKWHLGYASWDYTPTKRGFVSHVGYLQGMIDYYNKTFEIPSNFAGGISGISGYDWWHNTSLADSSADSTVYSEDLMQAELERVLQVYNASGKASNDEPLFLYYAQQIVHIPLESPGASYVERCLAANTSAAGDPLRLTYCAMMLYLDDSLGQLVGLLKQYNMWDDTLLLVSTDNGGIPNYGHFPASVGCNYPLRAGKGRVYEGGVRSIGFINGGDNVIPAQRRGAVYDGLVHMVDWLPTLLSAAQNGAGSLPQGLDGFDLLPTILSGQPTNRSSIPLDINLNISFPPDWGTQIGLLMSDGWKLVVDQVHGNTLNYDGYFPCPPLAPYPANTTESGLYLFNVFNDPNEHDNLYDSYPDQVQRLQAVLQSYIKSGYMHPQFNAFDPAGAPELHHGVWAPWLKSSSQ